MLVVFSWQIFCLLIYVHNTISTAHGGDKTELLAKQRRDVDDANQSTLSCPRPGETPFSFSVTSVRVSGHRVNRTGPPPYGYTEQQWSLWDYNYFIRAEVTYTVTHPSHCTREYPFHENDDCHWPNTVPNVLWYLSKLDDSNFTQTSVSTRQPSGQYSTTVVATNPSVIPHVVLKLAVQSADLTFRFDKTFTQSNIQENTYERSYPSITFHCYPRKTVRVVEDEELILTWSFTIKPTSNQTKAELLEHRLWFQGLMMDKEYLNRPPHLYKHKLDWASRLSGLNKNGTPVYTSGLDQNPYVDHPGQFFGELEELDDGYKVNLQLRFPGDVVYGWMKGIMRLDFGSTVSETNIGIDEAQTDNSTYPYFRDYSCPFDADMLNVAIGTGSMTRGLSYNRYLEVELGHDLPNNAHHLGCTAYGCNIDKLELRRNGQAVHTYYQPDDSDNILQQGFGSYKRIRWYRTHVTEDTLGTYECFASDKSGNSTSDKVEVIAKQLVKAKLLEWTENYAIIACRGTGIPLPSLSFTEKKDSWQWEVSDMQPIEYGEVRMETRWVRDSWFLDEPDGLVVEAVANITMPADSLKNKVIVCRLDNVYRNKMAEVTMNPYSYPRKARTWD